MVRPISVDRASEIPEIESGSSDAVVPDAVPSSDTVPTDESPLAPEHAPGPLKAGDYYQHSPPPPVQSTMYRQSEDPFREIFRTVKAMLWSTAFISFLLVLVLSFFIVLAMTPEIQQWITIPSVQSVDDPTVLLLPRGVFFIIFPFPVLLFTFSGTGFQVWHILMLSILIGAFTYGKYDLLKNWFSRKNQYMLSLLAPEKANSSLEGVAKLFMATSFFSVVYFIFLAMINVQMNTPPFDEFSRPELIYGLFNASVFEELVSRVLLVGVPLVIIGLIRKWKNPLKKLIGGGLDITPATMGLIIFSGIFFALAHVGSWDLWKVPQVLVTGLALGYAFVRYGLHASILIHFSINLSSSAMDIWPNNIILGSLLGIAFFIWIVIGSYFFFDYIWRLLKKLEIVQKPQPTAQAPPFYPGHAPPGIQHSSVQPGQALPHTPPAVNQQPPNWPPKNNAPPPLPVIRQPNHRGFVCPNCNHTGAVYSDGKLTCMHCGTTFGESKQAQPEDPDKEMFEF